MSNNLYFPFKASLHSSIVGLLVMIEDPEVKTVWIVALGTGPAEPALVVWVLVATLAGARRILEGVRPVAFLARYGGVEADQREPRQIVVEFDFLAPARLGMTALASFAELALVRIALFVARDARCRKLFL